MDQTNRELLHGQNTAEENPNKENFSEQLIVNEEYKDTKLRIVGHKEKGYAVAIGNKALTEFKKTRAEAEEMIENKDWGMIITLIATISTLQLEEIMETGRKELDSQKGQ